MPEYEYVCRKCGKKFSVTLSLSEREKKTVHCPKCEAIELDPLISAVHTKTSKKS